MADIHLPPTSGARRASTSGQPPDACEADDVVVEFSSTVQSLGALQEAAYRLIGHGTCHIDEADGRWVCRLSPTEQLYGPELRSYFLTLVTDENLREKVHRETDRLRDVIVALAFGSLAQEL